MLSLEMNDRWIEPGDNPDITKERKAARFNVREMSAFVHGGEEILKRRAEILEFVESKSEFRDPIPIEFMSREQRYEEQARKAVAMTELATDAIDGSDFFGEGMLYQSLIMGRDLHAMSLHYVMFLPTIQGQTDEEQLDEWLGLVISRGILGTYAQTEILRIERVTIRTFCFQLGHGTNLSRLETTATYDPKTEEFVLHSPTVTAAKWWPGALGKSSTHCILMAQLYTQGRCFGPHPFIVQLRDLDTHKPLKGIRVGDIGPKLGINGSDNGYLLFDHVRIPRKNLLMRYAKVNPNGEYVPPKHSKLGFGSMVFVRSIMIRDQAMQLGAACTIATRYSAIRRQGVIKGNDEAQIIDYQTQQFRVFVQIARTVIFLFAASEVRDLYLKVTEQLTTGNVGLLPELHALSSGLKSVVSWEVANGIEQCRLACGGHGYSLASAFPEIYAYAVGGCTYEGENIVMLLQVARQLLKRVQELKSGRANLAEIEGYLGKKSAARSSFTDYTSDAACLIEDYEHVARQQIFYVAALHDRLKTTMPVEDAWNRCSVELCRASRLHVKTYLIRNYFAYIGRFQGSAEVRGVLQDLGKLYALDQIVHAQHHFTKNGYFNESQAEAARSGVYELLARLRPNAVGIVDSFDYSDRELHSVLGRRDGNVYPALLEWAQQSQLNKEDVLPAYHKHLGPMMKESRSKL
ncbi:Acyl-CoA oxidase dehydrogenase and Acyl-CoA oxidase domain containing protein [Aphelenchoides fujianensis]|nr:Acyl-CoA oxidase dehydrogenase and Acyl-CoA oxidase domain containing protein [Aphelenchoides fujianensis]